MQVLSFHSERPGYILYTGVRCEQGEGWNGLNCHDEVKYYYYLFPRNSTERLLWKIFNIICDLSPRHIIQRKVSIQNQNYFLLIHQDVSGLDPQSIFKMRQFKLFIVLNFRRKQMMEQCEVLLT